MKRFFLILTAVLMIFLPSRAEGRKSGFTASDAFAKMPMSYMELLDPSTRLDMLDYFAVDSVYQATNNMGGKSELVTVTPTYLKLRLTPVSTWEIKLLPAKKGMVAAAVYTVGADSGAPDSSLYFFDSEMKPLPAAKFFSLPRSEDFFSLPSGAPVTKKEIDAMIDFLTVAYTLSPDSDSMNAEITVSSYMNRDDYDKIRKYEIPGGITYHWDGSRFRLQKK